MCIVYSQYTDYVFIIVHNILHNKIYYLFYFRFYAFQSSSRTQSDHRNLVCDVITYDITYDYVIIRIMSQGHILLKNHVLGFSMVIYDGCDACPN